MPDTRKPLEVSFETLKAMALEKFRQKFGGNPKDHSKWTYDDCPGMEACSIIISDLVPQASTEEEFKHLRGLIYEVWKGGLGITVGPNDHVHNMIDSRRHQVWAENLINRALTAHGTEIDPKVRKFVVERFIFNKDDEDNFRHRWAFYCHNEQEVAENIIKDAADLQTVLDMVESLGHSVFELNPTGRNESICLIREVGNSCAISFSSPEKALSYLKNLKAAPTEA